MANAATVNDKSIFGFLLASSTTNTTPIILDDRKSYSFHHTGLDVANAAATNPIILGINSAPSAYDCTVATNKLILKSDTVITLPAGVKQVFFQNMTAGAPVMNVVASELSST